MTESSIFDHIKIGDAIGAESLLAAQPDSALAVNETGVSALMLALYYRRPGIAEAIRMRREELSVFEASAFGDMFELQRNLDADPALVNAESPDGFSPLGLACFFGRLKAVEMLLARGANVEIPSNNSQRVRPLHSACAHEEPILALELSALLLAAGAKANTTQEGGITPLHEAAASGNTALAEILLRYGADKTIRSDNGKTAVDMAKEKGYEELAEILRV